MYLLHYTESMDTKDMYTYIGTLFFLTTKCLLSKGLTYSFKEPIVLNGRILLFTILEAVTVVV